MHKREQEEEYDKENVEVHKQNTEKGEENHTNDENKGQTK